MAVTRAAMILHEYALIRTVDSSSAGRRRGLLNTRCSSMLCKKQQLSSESIIVLLSSSVRWLCRVVKHFQVLPAAAWTSDAQLGALHLPNHQHLLGHLLHNTILQACPWLRSKWHAPWVSWGPAHASSTHQTLYGMVCQLSGSLGCVVSRSTAAAWTGMDRCPDTTIPVPYWQCSFRCKRHSQTIQVGLPPLCSNQAHGKLKS